MELNKNIGKRLNREIKDECIKNRIILLPPSQINTKTIKKLCQQMKPREQGYPKIITSILNHKIAT